MKKRSADIFSTVRSEGPMLPPEILARIQELDPQMGGLTPEAFHLDKGEKVNEAINRSWNRLVGVWEMFRKAKEVLPDADPGTTLTREKWLLKLFDELGYGRLQLAKPVDVEGTTYAISHVWKNTPIHLIGFRAELDKTVSRRGGATYQYKPHSMVQMFLNRTEGHLWAFLSNGLKLRILRDNTSLVRQAYVEFDLEAMMEGGIFPDFKLLWLLCHQSRVEADRPEDCWLERWSRATQELGTRLREDLQEGVRKAIEVLGAGFLGHPANDPLREELRSGRLDKQEYYRELLRFVYQLIFLFVAEDRDLLAPPSTAPEAKDRYIRFYSTTRLRFLAGRKAGTRHDDLYRVTRLVIDSLGEGEGRADLGIPVLNSSLFSVSATPSLKKSLITNADYLEAIRALAIVRDKHGRRPTDYRNLGSEELGSVYESLLEMHPDLNIEAKTFALKIAVGNERKTTGSYYTPTSLISCLLDSALDPVLDEAVGKENPEKAILDLKVCDPACGSGHFLIAAAKRMASRLTSVRAEGDEPSPDMFHRAIRDVIGRCIYGVDINPMAVELCKVSLWMEALEPGKPLSFLDHHIRAGNSLLGTTPDLIAAGLPDEAFTAIEGDDKKACAVLKKRNKAERKGLGPLFAQQETEMQARLQQAAAALSELPDDRPEEIRAKEMAFRRHEQTQEYRHKKQLADTWCAAFVIRKHFRETGREASAKGITQGHLIELAVGRTLPTDLAGEVEHLSSQYQFFHWHLAFPEVFAKGGFDCVLGNPPWENIKADPVEFFAVVAPTVAAAPTANARAVRIEELILTDSDLRVRWDEHKRHIAGQQHIISSSGRFLFGAHGKCNTMPLFLDLFASFASSRGHAGIVVKSVIGTDAEYQPLFQHLVETARIAAFFDFINERGLFPDVHRQERFALITVSPSGSSPCGRYAFLLENSTDLLNKNRVLALSRVDLMAMASGSCRLPTVTTPMQVRLLIAVARNCGASFLSVASGADTYIMLDGGKVASAPGFCTVDSFTADRGSRAFGKNSSDEEVVAVYEGKLFGNLDHRYRTFEGLSAEARYGKTPATNTLADEDKRDPFRTVEPRYWVSRRFVVERMRGKGWTRNWLVLHGRKGNRDNQRTFSIAVVPVCASVDVAPIILPRAELDDFRPIISAVAVGQTLVFDFLVRIRLVGFSIGKNLLEEIPAPRWVVYIDICQWEQTRIVFDWLLPRVLELIYTAWDLKPFAQDCGWSGPPFRWDEERRFLLRCELDAAFFHLYLPAEGTGDWRQAEGETAEDLLRLKASFSTPREAVAYIMDTFPIVKRKDEAKYGTYRTKDTILEIYDAMSEAMRTGHPYQTKLDPPPADPRCCHPEREHHTS